MKRIITIIMLFVFFAATLFPVCANAGSPFPEHVSGDYKYYVLEFPGPYLFGQNTQLIKYAVITQYRGSGTKVVIPDELNGMAVYGLDNGAFRNNKKIRSVTIPRTVKTIGPSTFEGCTSLKTVKFPALSAVSEIHKRAFYNCTSLNSITFPTQVKYIEEYAFGNCYALSRIYLNAYRLESVGKNAFANVGKKCSDTIFVTGEAECIPQNMFACSTSDPAYINRAFIGISSHVQIGKNAFKNCTALHDNYLYAFGSGDDKPFGSKNTLGVPGKTVVHTWNKESFIHNYLEKYGYSYKVFSDGELPIPEMTLSTVASSGKTRISWKYDERYGKIEVYRSEKKTSGYKRLTTTYAFNESYTDKTAEPGKVYYYKIRTAGGSFCSPKYRTCKLPRPVVTATASGSKIKLTWGAIDGAVSYKVYRSTQKDGEYKLIKTTTNTSFINSSVQRGVTYYYKVRAVCAVSAGNSAYSTVVSAKVR